jgi:hypothetical protein
MIIDWFYTLHALRKYWEDEGGLAALEAALLFPPLVALLYGVYDLGKGIILSGRTITASEVSADLISRDKTVNMADVNEAIEAAKLVYEPYDLSEFGIDIVSVRFDNNRSPVILWRETRDMSPNHLALENIDGIGDPGEGMIVVTVEYTYIPFFAKYFTDPIEMVEVAYTRGRRSPTVTWGG